MKNKLSDLNDHLFAQLERLSDESLSTAAMEHEGKRSVAMVAIADKVLRVAAVQIQAARIAQEAGADPVGYLPASAIVDVTPRAPRLAAPQTAAVPAPVKRLAPFPPFKGATNEGRD